MVAATGRAVVSTLDDLPVVALGGDDVPLVDHGRLFFHYQAVFPLTAADHQAEGEGGRQRQQEQDEGDEGLSGGQRDLVVRLVVDELFFRHHALPFLHFV